MCLYFRKFLECFSVLARPLSDVKRKNVSFDLGKEEVEAFDELKSRLIRSPILAIYSPQDETELH